MKWLADKKKKIIVAVIVAALSAAVPQLPSALTTPIVDVIYSLFDSSSEVLP